MKKIIAIALTVLAIAAIGCAADDSAIEQTYETNCIVTELDTSENEFTVIRQDGHIFTCELHDGHMPRINDELIIEFDNVGTENVTDDVPINAYYAN